MMLGSKTGTAKEKMKNKIVGLKAIKKKLS